MSPLPLSTHALIQPRFFSLFLRSLGTRGGDLRWWACLLSRLPPTPFIAPLTSEPTHQPLHQSLCPLAVSTDHISSQSQAQMLFLTTNKTHVSLLHSGQPESDSASLMLGSQKCLLCNQPYTSGSKLSGTICNLSPGLNLGCLLDGIKEAALPSILLLRWSHTGPYTTLAALVRFHYSGSLPGAAILPPLIPQACFSIPTEEIHKGLPSLRPDLRLLSQSLLKVADLFPHKD